jgi:hypothetical protein
MGGALVIDNDDGTKRQCQKALENTQKSITRSNALQRELDRVWEQIRLDAIEICPKQFGDLSRTIRVVNISTDIMEGVWSRTKEVAIYNKSIVAGDESLPHSVRNQNIIYASWVHDGHKMPDGSFWAGVPFLTLAIAKNEGDLEKAIDNALKRIGKQYQEGNK